MLIYLLVILLIFIMQYSLSCQAIGAERDFTESQYLKVICWILVLLATLRGSTVGTDTAGYWEEYINLPDITFKEVIQEHLDFPGYFVFAKVCSILHLPIQILFGLLEGLYVYAVYKFINRYSVEKLYSILGFLVIGLFEFSLAGLKQTMSMAFVLLYFLALDDRKYILTIILAVFAFLCHQASLIFLAGIALYFMRNLRSFYVYLALVVVAVLSGTGFLWNGMLSLLENDHYSELYAADEGYSSTSMIIYGVYLLILYIFCGRYRQLKPLDSRVMLGMSTLAFAFQAFAFVSSAAFRLSFYFLPFMIVAFPNGFNCIRDDNLRRFVRIGVGLLLILVFIYTNRNGGSVVPYRFFWQG